MLVLHEFIALNRAEIIRRCRAKVATRSIPPPTEAEIDHGVPVFLDQLRDALRLGEITSPETGRSAMPLARRTDPVSARLWRWLESEPA